MMLMIFLKELEAVITSVIQPEGIGERELERQL